MCFVGYLLGLPLLCSVGYLCDVCPLQPLSERLLTLTLTVTLLLLLVVMGVTLLREPAAAGIPPQSPQRQRDSGASPRQRQLSIRRHCDVRVTRHDTVRPQVPGAASQDKRQLAIRRHCDVRVTRHDTVRPQVPGTTA